MNSVLKVILLLLVLAVAMLLISWLVPDVNAFVRQFAGARKLPIWVVGLFGPIAFLFSKMGDFVGGIFGTSKTEQQVSQENEEIKTERERLMEDVRKLNEWRNREIDLQRREIDLLNQKLSGLRAQSQSLDARIEEVREKPTDEFGKQFTPEEIQSTTKKWAESQGIDYVE